MNTQDGKKLADIIFILLAIYFTQNMFLELKSYAEEKLFHLEQSLTSVKQKLNRGLIRTYPQIHV